jgi:hypothetical protein
MVDKTYDMDDDSTVKSGNISASEIHGEISAIQDEVPAETKKKVRMKTMDINETHYNMGHMGEVAFMKIFKSSQHKSYRKIPKLH